ncbi:hypothetical protein Tco_0087632 [Tanacetum coccineum]
MFGELVPRPEGKTVIASNGSGRTSVDAEKILCFSKQTRLDVKMICKKSLGRIAISRWELCVGVQETRLYYVLMLRPEYVSLLHVSSKLLDAHSLLGLWIQIQSDSMYLIIMAQQQHATDFHPDELCPPNKRYDLMDANKKVDLEHVQCPPESKILTNIIKNHPLRFSIAASSSVPWFYGTVLFEELYHNMQDDDIMKNTFNSGRHKDKVGMKIPNCMITEGVAYTEHYRMEDEITVEVYELKRREKGKVVEESRSTPLPTPIRSPRTHTHLVSSDTEKLQELTKTHTQTTSSSRSQHTKLSRANHLLSLFKAKPARFKRYKNFFQELQGRYTYLFEHLKERFLSRKSFDTLADHLQEVMVESLPTMVDTHIKEQVKKQVPEQVRDQVPVYVAEGKGCILEETKDYKKRWERSLLKLMRQYEQQDIAIWLALQMKFENLQVQQTTCRPSAVRLRDQDDPHDDAHPEGENSAKLQKTSEYERPGRNSCSLHHPERHSIVQSCQRDLEAPALSLINQDLLYLKKGSLGPEKIILSLHKFLAIIFNDMISKNELPEGGIKPGKPKEEVYSNSKIIQVIKTYWELGHEHKFVTEIVARRANECIVSITEPDYKNLNKNDIEDMYLLIMNGKVPDYAETGLLWSLSVFIRSLVIWERVHDFQLGIESYQQKVNLTTPTMSFPRVEKHRMFSIIYEPVHGIIYKNSKKEKRVIEDIPGS